MEAKDKKAIDLYLEGFSVQMAAQRTGTSMKHVHAVLAKHKTYIDNQRKVKADLWNLAFFRRAI